MSTEEHELRFMDGPFSVAIFSKATGSVSLTARGSDSRENEPITCGSNEPREQLVAAATTVLKYCEQESIDDVDVRALRHESAQLR